jgi:hypothetical protein
MRRRKVIAGLGAALALPVATAAQQPEPVRRVGVLIHLAESTSEGQARIAAVRRELHRLGWSEGRNLKIDERWSGGKPDLARAHAAELVALHPDAIIAGNSEVAKALQGATGTVPVVFAEVIDPAGNGLVPRLSHPGGNLTGFTMFEFALAAKWLELLKQVVPALVPPSITCPAVAAGICGRSGLIGGRPPRFTADFLLVSVTVQVTVAVAGRLAGCQFCPSSDSNRWKRAPCFLIFLRKTSLNRIVGTVAPFACSSPGPLPGNSGPRKKSGSSPSRAMPIGGKSLYLAAMTSFSSAGGRWAGHAENRSRRSLS